MEHPITLTVPAANQHISLKSAWAAGIASDDFAILDLEAIKAEGRRRKSDAVHGKPFTVDGIR